MSDDVVILFGGASSERFVSVASAQNISAHLPDADLWFLSADGQVFVTKRETLAAHENPFVREFDPAVAVTWRSLRDALSTPYAKKLTFFIALHGGDGENGVIQRQFEEEKIAFTGSDSQASAKAFDKALTKELAQAKGARVAQERRLDTSNEAELKRVLAELLANSPRWVLKPQADGSSHGLVHLRAPDEIEAAAKKLHSLKLPYLAEVFIEGRELTVGVVHQGGSPRALQVSEVRVVPGGAFDYEGKYLGKGTEELTPAPLDSGERKAARELAVLTHKAVGCFGYSRTDMILTADGPVLLEINTLPGMTKASFIPQQLASVGRDLKEFLAQQLNLARARRDGTA